MQVDAAQKVRELFPNLEGVTVDLTLPEDNATTVDTEAGGLGMPFTQQEHEEEWVNWVPWADWGQVEAQMGGAGSS